MSRGLETHNGHVVLSGTLTLSASIELILRSGIWVFSGEGLPNGAIDPWLSAPTGSIYLNEAPGGDFYMVIWYKTENNGVQEDWGYVTGSVMG